jgi:hypothetical protein
MVVVEFHRADRDRQGSAEPGIVTRLVVDGTSVMIDGAEQDLDFDLEVLSARTGELIAFVGNEEDWARSLPGAYRTPYLWAEVVEDTAPLDDVIIKPTHLEDPAEASRAAYS